MPVGSLLEPVSGVALDILDSIADALYAVDRDWRLTYVNPHAAKLWSVDRDAALGRVVWDLFPGVNFAVTDGFRSHRRAFDERLAIEDEFFSVAAGRWVRVNLYPTRDGGLVVHYRDITESHAAKVEQERLVGLVGQLSEERARLMAVAGHDLRQPLQVIALCLEKLARDGVRPDGQLIEIARSAVARMNVDLEMLAMASQLDQGIEPRLEMVQLAPFLREQAEAWRHQAQAKGLGMRIPNTRLTVITDRRMLRTILHNLIGNAVKYTQAGGILVGCRSRGDNVAIEVTDTGPGIPEPLQDQIFEAFRQLDTGSDGLGLGLSIVRRTAARLGHRIELTSRPGHGSRFAVIAPRPVAEQAQGLRGLSPPPQQEHRLLREDIGGS
jgi:PAS domain S-box-containing protein